MIILFTLCLYASLCKGNIISGEASSKREFMCYLLQSSLQEKCIDYSGQEEGAEMSIRNIHNTPLQ